MAKKLSIGISGAGIAGLTAALALAKAGHGVTVFERAPELTEIGAGLQLSPNAMRALGRLGLARGIDHWAFEPEALKLHTATGAEPLAVLPLGAAMRETYGAPYFVVHRSDLQFALLDAASAQPLITLKTGSPVSGVLPQPAGVTLVLAGGARSDSFDAVVAADGIRSNLRAQIDPAARIVRDGQTAWRGTLTLDAAADVFDTACVSLVMGRGCHLVAYRMGGRPEFNLVFIADDGVHPAEAAAAWRPAVAGLIAGVGNWQEWPLASVESATWANGRMVMIGDAAHAMTPHAAQGGAMAIEDAETLAISLKAGPTIEAALASFGETRSRRAARVASLSTSNRNVYQATGALAFARDRVMQAAPASMLLRRMDWLYGWE